MSNELKINVAKAAISYIQEGMIIGVGTGTTVNYFIQELALIKHKIEACVASSKATEALLRSLNIPLMELNAVGEVAIYFDSADEINHQGEMIKGGGGALTREKIIATNAHKFICLVDESKWVKRLTYPIAVEVIPMARSAVARNLVRLGSSPEYRQGFITDNGNIILDVFHMNVDTPLSQEQLINAIVGVVENGIFAQRAADEVLIACKEGKIITHQFKSN